MPTANTTQGGISLASAAYAIGRGAGRLNPVAAGASRVGAVAGGAAVSVLWAMTCGWANLRKYRKGKLSKKEATKKTAAESIGIGLATGVGIVAINVIRASALVAGSAALVPFLLGTVVTSGAKAVWDRKVAERLPDLDEGIAAETGSQDDEPGVSSILKQ